MQGTLASEWKTQEYWTVLAAGAPKGAGKTTLALSATTPEKPTVVVSCDLGRLSIPPGVPRDKILVIPYHDLTRKMTDKGGSTPVKDVYLQLTRDLYNVYTAVKNREPIQMEDGSTFPTPANVVLDGVSRLNNMLVDGQCALNNINDPSDLENKAFKFWGKRLRNILTIVEQFCSLPCNVILTTWIDPQKDSTGTPTGVWLPDVGGKMDLLTAGIVGAAVRCYSKSGKFYVQTKADGIYPWCGVRDKYNLKGEIDVTITGAAGEKSPWEKVFGAD